MSDSPDLPPIRPLYSRRGAVAVAFGLVLAYAAIRTIVHALLPVANDLQWTVRDTVMDVPRAFFLFVSWRYGRRLWTANQLGLHWRKGRECAVVGSLLCLTVLARPVFFATQLPAWIPLYVLGCFAVGLFEEILFRGVLQRALYDHYGQRASVWGTSLAFVAFLAPAQPVHLWPGTFVIGLLLSLMRAQGVSTWCLAILHIVFNSLVMALTPAVDFPPFWHLSVFLVDAYLTAMYALAYRTRLLKPGAF